MLPSPSEIQYFIEVARTENISRAAERLGIRQPTLSMSLAKLESNIGTSLLTRTKKGVHLTEAGQVFLEKAQGLLQAWEELRKDSGDQVSEVKGLFRLGCHASVALYTLPLFMKDFLKSHPSIEFSMEHDFSRKITEGVISLRLDLGIVVNPVRHPDLIIKKICEDHVGFWKSDKSNATLDKVLIADENLMQTQSILQKSKKTESRFNRFIRTSSLELVRELTVQGCGTGILPGRVALMGGGKGLQLISELPTHKDEICLVYRAERRDHRTLREIVKAVSAAIK